MQDRPTATELLTTIGDLLEQEVLPAVSGPLQHRVRVAGNLCRILAREAETGPASDARERELLASLLGRPTAGDASTLELTTDLTERLAGSHDAEFESRAWPVLLEIVRGKIAIAKPGHDSYDFAGEKGA